MELSNEQLAIEYIGRARQILIVAPKQPKTDAVSGIMAIGSLLNKLNKNFEAVIPEWSDANWPPYLFPTFNINPQVSSVRCLSIAMDLKNNPLKELKHGVNDGRLEISLWPQNGEYKTEDIVVSQGSDQFDLIISIGHADAASLARFNKESADLIYRTNVINIDNQPDNSHWGQVNLVNPKAVSLTEIIHTWIQAWKPELIDAEIATALLAGMIAETKSYRTNNVTPLTLENASLLSKMGAKREAIVSHLWRTRSLPVLKLWGRTASRLQHEHAIELAWSYLTEADFVETSCTPEDLQGVVEELISSVPGVKYVMVVYQHQGVKTAAVLGLHGRSAIDLARHFGGSGDQARATFILDGTGTLAETVAKIIQQTKNILKT